MLFIMQLHKYFCWHNSGICVGGRNEQLGTRALQISVRIHQPWSASSLNWREEEKKKKASWLGWSERLNPNSSRLCEKSGDQSCTDFLKHLFISAESHFSWRRLDIWECHTVSVSLLCLDMGAEMPPVNVAAAFKLRVACRWSLEFSLDHMLQNVHKCS